MSLSTATRLVQYTLSGSGQPLTVSFKFFAASDLVVVKTVAGVDTTLTINTDYTVTGGGTPAATGTVTMVAGTAGDVITIYGAEPYTQGTDLTNNGPFPAVTLTAMVDRLTILVQQTRLDIGRSLRIPKTNAVTATPEMTLANRASALIAFNSSGDLDFTFGATYYANVLAAAAAAATSATAAAGSASAASTSATSAATSASAASTSATTATTQASAAATSATAAATSATSAATSAISAATSATSAGTSATNAASSATSAAGHDTSAAAYDASAGAHDASSAAHDTSAGNYAASAAASATAAAGYVVPSQTGNAGKFLGTNGSVTAWYSSTLDASLLTGTALASNVVTSSLTAVGTVTSGSWASTLAATGGTIAALTGFSLRDTSAAFNVTLAATASAVLTANRTLTFDVSNGNRTLKLTASAVVNQDVSTGGSPSFVQMTSIVGTGAQPLVVASTTRVANLNVATAGTADTLTNARTINGVSFDGSANIGQDLRTSASPTFVGATFSGALSGITTLSASGVITSTLATGTAPFAVASTTAVTNLNASLLLGNTWASPGTIGGDTAGAATFTTLSATGSASGGAIAFGPSFSPLAWGTNSLDVNGVSGGLIASYFNGTAVGYFIASSGTVVDIVNRFDGHIRDTINGTVRSDLTASGLTIGGTLSSAAPTNGAGAWKFGKIRTGVAIAASTVNVLEVEVDGTRYDLILATTLI